MPGPRLGDSGCERLSLDEAELPAELPPAEVCELMGETWPEELCSPEADETGWGERA